MYHPKYSPIGSKVENMREAEDFDTTQTLWNYNTYLKPLKDFYFLMKASAGAGKRIWKNIAIF